MLDVARNMVATWPLKILFDVVKNYFGCCEDSFLCYKHIFDVAKRDGKVHIGRTGTNTAVSSIICTKEVRKYTTLSPIYTPIPVYLFNSERIVLGYTNN